jgi:DNA adenine methylase
MVNDLQYMSLGNSLAEAKPFVKWAGGKTQLLGPLSALIPDDFNDYFEPFIGGGAMFFYLANKNLIRKRVFLSDINFDLINVYKCLRYKLEQLLSKLIDHQERYIQDRKTYYYKLRRTTFEDDLGKAAQLIALNKTCYNGLYRVNKKGMFNVPIGSYKKPIICDIANLKKVSTILNQPNIRIECMDYQQILQQAREDDFVYLDPPFSPISKTSNFTEYTMGGFGTVDQLNLARVFTSLARRKCKVVLSNSDCVLVRNLYKEFEVMQVSTLRSINCKSARRKGNNELIIYNKPKK